MADNPVIRRFFRREDDELTVHERAFTPMLQVVACHIVAGLADDPEVEVVKLTNFTEGFDVEQVAVCWETLEVGYGETRQFMTGCYLFAVHHGLGDLQLVAALSKDNLGNPHLRVVVRADDRERLDGLLEHIDRLERRGHPLRGHLFSLNTSSLAFLGQQNVRRDDVVLPAALLEEVERNFAFLDEPEAYPAELRHRALLLAGPPGVGKTMVAKWLSGRFDCTGIWVTPGAVWEQGPAAIFELARRLAPTLLVLEDLDVAAGERGGPQPLGELLGQLDGFADLQDVAVLATTNFPQSLDCSLDPSRRPGRFHRLLRIGPPDGDGRAALLRRRIASSEVLGEVAATVFAQLVELTEGATGAQVAELMTDLESRLLWARRTNDGAELAAVVAELARTGLPKGGSGLGFAVADCA